MFSFMESLKYKRHFRVHSARSFMSTVSEERKRGGKHPQHMVVRTVCCSSLTRTEGTVLMFISEQHEENK